MDDATIFFAILLALIGAFAVLAVIAAVRARRDRARHWWAAPVISVLAVTATLLAGVGGLLVVPAL